VVALWSSFLDQRSDERQFHGLPAHYVLRILEPIQRDEPVDYRSLGAELVPITLAEARERGLSDARATALLEADPLRRKALEVLRVTGGTPAAELLRTGDLLLEVDGELVTRVGELERLSDQDQARVVVFRDGAELTLELGTAPFDGRGVDRIVGWAGLQLHESHYEVAAQQGIDPDGIYIAWLWYGSPAARYGLRPTRRIVEVDGVPTPDLDVFLAAVDDMQDRQAVRVKMVALDGRTLVKTMKLDLTYWPTLVLERDDGEWVRREL